MSDDDGPVNHLMSKGFMMFNALFKQRIIQLASFLLFFVLLPVRSDDVLTIYSYNPLDVGGQLVEIIDIAFFEDRIIKKISTYVVGSDINAWKDDDFSREKLKLMWQFPQYNVKREDNIFTVESLRYDENINIVEDESDRNYPQYRYYPEEKRFSIKDADILINDDSSFYIQRNNSTIMQYEIDHGKSLYKYSYASSKNFHEYGFDSMLYSSYDYYIINDLKSRWKYEIEFSKEESLYDITSYDPENSEHLFEDRYVLHFNKRKITNYASCLNYFILPSRLRVLLPFVTNTPINQD